MDIARCSRGTHDEKLQLLRHYIEVVELTADDPKGKSGTYAMRLFPEVCSDRGFDWSEEGIETIPGDSETQNGVLPENELDAVESTEAELTESGSVRIVDQKAPRLGLYSNQGLVELGAYEINKLRRPFRVPFYEWMPVSAIPQPESKPKGPRYDRMKLACQYQTLLDSGEVKTRAELARHLGVSRARVTQVLRRLKN